MAELRSNTLNWPLRKALWYSVGVKEGDFDKPKIAIINSSSNLAPCFSHLDDIARVVAEELKKNGAVPFEVRTVAPSDFVFTACHGGYVQAGRDLLSYDVEASVEGVGLDGMVCLASCDKTLPGQLMAAARLDIPAIFIPCGYQPAGIYRGERFDIEDLFIQSGYHSVGKISDEEIEEMARSAIAGPGVCQGIGTANTMHVACEALGFCLPGTTPVLANSPAMWDNVRNSCRRIVEMVNENIRPSDLLSLASFENAAKTLLSVCGSTNSVKHLQAVAHNAGRDDIDVFKIFEKYSEETPILVAIKPNGSHTIDDMEAAGGTKALMKQLEPLLNLEAKTVSGKTVGENLADAVAADEAVIRPLTNPWNNRPAMILARGNLAPDYAMLKLQADDKEKPSYFRGPAKCFRDGADALAALRRGEIKKGDVIVVRGLGITGKPGMSAVAHITFALEGLGMRKDVAVISDGHTSGLCNAALMAVDITPEAAVGGPIGLLEDGDMIEIDAIKRTLNVELSDDVLRERRKHMPNYYEIVDKGWLKLEQNLAQPLNKGGVLE